MNIQYIVLGFLLEEPMSGYDIKQKLENSIAYFFDASYGAIYPALRRLEKDGSVRKSFVQQTGRPNKNIYFITPKGKTAFAEYMNSPLNPVLIRSDLLIRIFFGKQVDKINIEKWLLEEKKRAQIQLENLKSIYEEFPDLDSFKKMTLRFGIEDAEFKLNWIEKELRLLTNNKK